MAKNINKIMKQAQKMQAEMQRAQEELNQKTVEGTAGGQMVKVTLNGAQEMQKIELNPEVVDPDDVEMLEDLILAAFNNAQEKIKEMSSDTFGSITGGMNIPGLG